MAGYFRKYLSAGSEARQLDGYEELETGFIGSGIAKYAPTRDLTSAIIAIAKIIDGDRYGVSSIEIRGELPPVWIEGSEPLLRNARGAATIHTQLEKGVIVFLVELPHASTASALREAAAKQTATSDTAILGIARGNLFCLIVARTFESGKTIDETAQTLQRFVPPIESILDRTR